MNTNINPLDQYEMAHSVFIWRGAFGYGDKDFLKASSIHPNLIERDGYVYYIYGINIVRGSLSLVRQKLGTSEVSLLDELEHKNYEWDGEAWNPLKEVDGSSGLERNYHISLGRDWLCYTDDRGIHWMNLDGTDKHTFLPPRFKGAAVCLACGEHIVYRLRYQTTFYKYDRQSGETEALDKFKDMHVSGYTDTKLIFNNEIVYDINSREKTKIVKLYPKIKGKTVLLIDLARDVVYYEELAENWHDNRIVGVNAAGDIVDQWRMPQLDEELYQTMKQNSTVYSSYCTLCFDGRRISVKAAMREANGENHNPYVYVYDRNGECIRKYDLWNIKQIEKFGAHHYMTEHTICFLASGGSGYWIELLDETVSKCKSLCIYSR